MTVVIDEDRPSYIKERKDLNRKERTLLQYGEDAFEKENYPYAITIFRKLLLSAPGCLEVREKLHEAQVRRVKGKTNFLRQSWAGILAALFELWFMKLYKEEKYAEALDLAEYCMTVDPLAPASAHLVAKAAEAGDMFEIAKQVLEHSYRFNPNDIGIIEHLGFVYSQTNEGKKCLQMYRKLHELQPKNKVWEEKVKEATALASMEQAKLIDAEKGKATVTDMIRDREEAAVLEQAGRTHATEEGRKLLIENQIELINSQPTADNWRKLAELYREDEQFDKAVEAFQKVIEVSGVEDPAILRAITDLKVKKIEHEMEAVRHQRVEGAIDQASMEAKIAELKKQILETKKEASISILKKFPNNQEVRFELAQIYLEEGNYDEALPNFQKVQSNPRFRNKACMAIGQCFMEKGMLDLAAEQFKTVINETPMMDFTKKDAYYALGKCYMQQGQKQDALQCFKEIYQVDVNFRDVQQLFSQLSQSEGS